MRKSVYKLVQDMLEHSRDSTSRHKYDGRYEWIEVIVHDSLWSMDFINHENVRPIMTELDDGNHGINF
jgi:hypothetical protein